MEVLPPGPPPDRSSWKPRLTRLAVTLAVVGCFVGMGWAFTLNKSTDLPLGTAVEGVEPAFGAAAVPGQTPIRVDLQFGFTGELMIDETPLPVDEVTYEKAQAILTFTPGRAMTVGRFTNGIHRAQVLYWPLADPTNRTLFQWSFTVV